MVVIIKKQFVQLYMFPKVVGMTNNTPFYICHKNVMINVIYIQYVVSIF